MDSTLSPTVTTNAHRPERIAGTALLVATVAFLPQPFLIFLLPLPDAFIAPADLGTVWWRMTIQSVVWAIMASAALVAVLAARRAMPDTLWSSIGTVAGVIGAAAWAAEAALRAAAHAPFAEILATAPADKNVQATVLYLMSVVVGGFTVLGLLGIGVWLVMLGTAGVVLIGRVCATLAVIVGGWIAASILVLPQNPATFVMFLIFAVLGVAMLVRSRTIRPSTAVD